MTEAERAALVDDDAPQPQTQQPETEYRQEPIVPLAVTVDHAGVRFGSTPGRSRNARYDDGLEVSRALGAMVGGSGAADFNALDRLSGLALEKAMAGMSPDERDAYMRAG